MNEKEILLEAINIIGEYGHTEKGEVVQTYSDLILSIENFMKEVGYNESIF